MHEQQSTRNEFSGNARNVVQAQNIREVRFGGDPISPEPRETQRRWEQRQQRIMDAEAFQAAEGQRRASQYVTVARWRRRIAVPLMLLAGAAAVWEQMHGWVLPGRQQWGALAALLLGAVAAIGWARSTWIIRKWDGGKTIKVPRSRLYW
ncbi:hypothetical protein [Streptomyces sp. S465]|uniref:hypothetical protein n=1 Tax=Streptomyces sp. S465 TaxID=2979468 RepID=UPI0022A8AAD1|nr:hypothetical protein [Streptomyces sp. S465]WAP55058.1 hypothetical protein N6H00_08735 [Streptomyces sp. S465]